MIEPTETESHETLNLFIEAMLSIARESRDDPSVVKEAPKRAKVRRLDEARAAREPDLCWSPLRAVSAGNEETV